jgi:nucleotide-binding universal stress UspA family protein
MFTRVVAPLDGSALAEQALPYAAEMAKRFGAPLVLVRAYDGPARATRTMTIMPSGAAAVGDPTTMRVVAQSIAEEQAEAKWYLAGQAERLREQGFTVKTALRDADPATAILEVAQGEPGGVIVMSTHGRGGLGRLLFGSVAQSVLQNATVPVLIVRGVAEAGRDDAPRLEGAPNG